MAAPTLSLREGGWNGVLSRWIRRAKQRLAVHSTTIALLVKMPDVLQWDCASECLKRRARKFKERLFVQCDFPVNTDWIACLPCLADARRLEAGIADCLFVYLYGSQNLTGFKEKLFCVAGLVYLMY